MSNNLQEGILFEKKALILKFKFQITSTTEVYFLISAFFMKSVLARYSLICALLMQNT